MSNTLLEGITQEKVKEAAKAFMEGATMKELKGISNDEMEAVYSLAFNFYRTGKYDDAEKLFNFLALFDHLNAKFWFGVGAVRQAKKNYKMAVEAYAFASFLDITNPKPQYHAAECFLAMGDKRNAASCIYAIEEFSPKDTEVGRAYRAKAEDLKKRIGEEVFKALDEEDEKKDGAKA